MGRQKGSGRCVICKKFFPQEELVILDNKKYCLECSRNKIKELPQKDEAKDKTSSEVHREEENAQPSIVSHKKGRIKGSKRCSACGKMTSPNDLIKIEDKYYCTNCSKSPLNEKSTPEQKNDSTSTENNVTCLSKPNLIDDSANTNKDAKKCVKTVTKTVNKRKIKCYQCKALFDPGDIIKIDGKNYCCDCGTSIKEKRDKETQYNKELNAFLYKLCNEEKDMMPFLCTQVKRLKDKNGWRTESILYTLKYIFEDAETPPIFDPEYGVQWLVERNYVKAKKYYTKIFQMKKIPEEEIMKILKMPPKEIHLKRSEIMKREQRFSERRRDLIYGPELTMDDIEDDEEYYEEVKDS